MGWLRRGKGKGREGKLIDLRALSEERSLELHFDLRYAQEARNVFGAALYPAPLAWLETGAAERLVAAQKDLSRQGLSLLVWDAYRPFSVQAVMFEHTPRPQFVARPRRDRKGRPLGGSDHNHGCALDVTLVEVGSGRPLPMGTDFDDFGAAAHHSHRVGTEERKNRTRLRLAMERAGFAPLEEEWWHYADPTCRQRSPAPLDIPLEDVYL